MFCVGMSQSFNAAKKEVDKKRRRRVHFLKQLFGNLRSDVSLLTIDCFSCISQHLKNLFNLLNHSKVYLKIPAPKQMVGFSGHVICLIRSPGFGILYQTGAGFPKY